MVKKRRAFIGYSGNQGQNLISQSLVQSFIVCDHVSPLIPPCTRPLYSMYSINKLGLGQFNLVREKSGNFDLQSLCDPVELSKEALEAVFAVDLCF